MTKLLKRTRQDMLFLFLFILIVIELFVMFYDFVFLERSINLIILFVLLGYNLFHKIKFNAFFKGIIFFFILSEIIKVFNVSGIYEVNRVLFFFPQFILLLAYFGLTHYSYTRFRRHKIKEMTSLYLMTILLFNTILTVAFVDLIIVNVTDIIQVGIIYAYCVISIVLGFTSFAVYTKDGANESFIFTAMSLSFIFSDTNYTLHNFLMPIMAFDMADIILTNLALYLMFRYVYEMQIIADDKKLEIERLERVEKEKEAIAGATRL